jgi:arylsulfatase A-like enzyme
MEDVVKSKPGRDEVRRATKLSLYAGLGIGTMVGVLVALYDTWTLNQLFKKQLYFTALDRFFTYISLVVLALVVALLVLYPMLHVIDRRFSAIKSQGLARLCLIAGGLMMCIGGYFMNRSEWFPEISSIQALIGNMLFVFLCLSLSAVVYKIIVCRVQSFPELGLNFFAKLYNGKLFGVLIAAYAGLASAAFYWNLKNRPTGPNIVLITIDTLRADRLGCYGYSKNTSPNIDRLAQQGVRFENFFAQRGLTWPSLTSILTSLYPLTHGVESNEVPLEASFLTLPEILKDAGYETAAFLTNFFHAPNRGFDVKKGGAIGDLDRTVTDLALRWLDGRDEDKFFLWLHYKNPHAPYDPPAEFRNEEIRAYDGPFDGSWATTDSIYIHRLQLEAKHLRHLKNLYDAEIKATDSYIGEVLAKLDELKLTDDTFIIFSADHGEELYDHNYYFYHGCSVYDGVLRIPLILKYPKLFPAGKAVENLFESVDLTPTILQTLKMPLRSHFEGRSFFHVIFEGASTEWHQVFGERSRKIYLTRTPQWKFIYNPDGYHSTCVRTKGDQGEGFIVQPEELYDIVSDPRETNNLIGRFPAIADSLRDRLLDWAESNKTAHVPQKLTKEAEERLRALGYIQ